MDPSGLRLNYDLGEQRGFLLEEDVLSDPIKQFELYAAFCQVSVGHRQNIASESKDSTPEQR